MALELVGARMIQPVFGNSVDLWAAVISTFIGALSIGYVIGGQIADRMRTNLAVGVVLALAAVGYLILPLYALPFCQWLPPSVQEARWGALVAACALFLPVSICTGAVSPLLVRLAWVSADRTGRTVGVMYAVGSLGNVAGILVTDYWLLTTWTVGQIVVIMGVALAITGCVHMLWQLRVHGVHASNGAIEPGTSAAPPAPTSTEAATAVAVQP
jgi:hypothetical protein